MLRALRLFLLCAAPLFSQALQFEVASIRPSPPITQELVAAGLPIGKKITGDHLSIGFSTLSGLLQWAYEIKDYQLTGPEWMNFQRFNIEATMPKGATQSQFPALLRALLEERFQLKARKETREASVYLLTVDPARFRVKPAVPTRAVEPAQGGVTPTTVRTTGGAEVFTSETGTVRRITLPHGFRMEWDAITLTDYADVLESLLSVPVINRTGLEGAYPLSIDFEADQDQEVRLLDSARSYGLKLDRGKAPIDHIIVEHLLEQPTEN